MGAGIANVIKSGKAIHRATCLLPYLRSGALNMRFPVCSIVPYRNVVSVRYVFIYNYPFWGNLMYSFFGIYPGMIRTCSGVCIIIVI